jgi:hypothetical protein
MTCNKRSAKFPTGQPGSCIDGQLDLNVIQLEASASSNAPNCTSHSDTQLADLNAPPPTHMSVVLGPGRYVFEISGTFDMTSKANDKYTYFHSFKYSLLTGTWQIIDSAKKEIVNESTSTSASQLIHLKSDIITFTTTKTVGYFHGVLKTNPADGPAQISEFNFIIYKL